MDDGSFLRQRRNVFVVSMILLALCLGGADLEELTFAGMKFSVFKWPEVFLYGVWLMFGYFAYRYTLHFLEGSPAELRKFLHRELDAAAGPRLLRLVRSRYPHATTQTVSYMAHLKHGRVCHGQEKRPPPGDPNRNEYENFAMPIPRSSVLAWELLGVLRFAVITPALTEHVLPLVLAAWTFIYCGFMVDWKGSLLPVFRGFLGLS